MFTPSPAPLFGNRVTIGLLLESLKPEFFISESSNHTTRRRSTAKYLLLGVAALFGLNLFSRAQAAGSLGFLPGRIKSFTWQGLSPVITFELIVQNTSNHAFNIYSIAGSVYALVNGKNYLIGYLSDFTSQSIAPHSQTTLIISAKLQVIGIVSDLLTALNAGNFSQVINLNATANVDYLQIPIEYSYKLAV